MGVIKKLNNLPDSRIGNRTELMTFMGITHNTVDDWVSKGMPVIKRPTPGDSGWIFDYKACAEWRIKWELGVFDEGIDPETMTPKERKDWYDGEMKRIQVAEKQGTLIPASEVEEILATSLNILVQNLRTLPDMLERDLSLTNSQAQFIEEKINLYCKELGKKLEGIDGNNT